jgi:peptidoglycan/xylan/chitin deacetylase (PgdA/CDA1 family)
MRPIPILTYHQIAQAPERGAPMRSLYVSPSAFALQMQSLSLLGYKGLSMTALMPYLQGKKTGKVVGITFDDGYLNNLENAAEVLKRFNFSSTCYVVSELMGKTNEWDRALGIASASLMNLDQLKQWIASGQEVGSHTQHHVDLTATDLQTSQPEILNSRISLSQQLNTDIQQFCYPYGRYASEHVDIVKSSGYVAATTTARGKVHADDSTFELRRIPVVRSTSLPQFLFKVLSSYEDRYRVG